MFEAKRAEIAAKVELVELELQQGLDPFQTGSMSMLCRAVNLEILVPDNAQGWRGFVRFLSATLNLMSRPTTRRLLRFVSAQEHDEAMRANQAVSHGELLNASPEGKRALEEFGLDIASASPGRIADRLADLEDDFDRALEAMNPTLVALALEKLGRLRLALDVAAVNYKTFHRQGRS